jgi:hypothetical protein
MSRNPRCPSLNIERPLEQFAYTKSFAGDLHVAEIPKLSLTEKDAAAVTALSDPSTTSRWAFINGWQVEPQSNDRAPAPGELGEIASIASPSAGRPTARRKHQKKFKAWSQARHD